MHLDRVNSYSCLELIFSNMPIIALQLPSLNTLINNNRVLRVNKWGIN